MASGTKWGHARVQLLAKKDEIADLLNQGYPKTTIYHQLFGEKPSFTYATFCIFCKKNILSK